MALATVRDLAQRASTVDASIVALDCEFVAALIPDILKKMHPNGITINHPIYPQPMPLSSFRIRFAPHHLSII